MGNSQLNIISMALCNQLVGTTLYTKDGDFLVLDFIEYDSMTHQFILEVQNVQSTEVTIREFSDKLRYECDIPKKNKPNSKRINPKKR